MNDIRQLLHHNIASLLKANTWLQSSYQKCSDINWDDELSMDDLDALEAFSARFSRVIDLLLQKVFRSIEEIELSSGGTLLDVIHRFQKRGLDLNEDQIRQMRVLRNLIAHEYLEDHLIELFKELLAYAAPLNNMIEQTIEYVKRKGYALIED